MIRIQRGPEPHELAPIRQAEIARVSRGLRGNPTANPPVLPRPLSSDLVGEAYRDFAKPLWQQQFLKCCYCENRVLVAFNDVEHYRPKAQACQSKVKPRGCVDGYWWLAWTWENLLFACPGCNRTAKNDLFPLADPSGRLAAGLAPPGNEAPWLIDPSAPSADPEAHLDFVLAAGADAGHIYGRDVQGKESVKAYGLDRDELVEVRRLELANLQERMSPIGRMLGAGQHQVACEVWQALLDSWANPRQPFAALGRAALMAFWQSLAPAEQFVLARPPDKVW